MTLFGTKPRALAASADGRYLYAAVYLSANGTTTVSGEDAVRLGYIPQLDFDEIPFDAIPKQGAIVQRTERGWRDYQQRDWTPAVPFDLPDYDVFVIDTALESPKVVERIRTVGTVLFNLTVQPSSGEIRVSNTEALNLLPYESRLRAKFAHNHITRIHSTPSGGHQVRAVNFEHVQIGRDMKTAHLRNIYQKVGRFNVSGPQVAGYGLLHDGTMGTVVDFLRLDPFFFPGKTQEEKDVTRRLLNSYIMAFDTGMAPAVGRQLTLSSELNEEERRLIHLLMTRAGAGDCDLTAKGWQGAALRGWLYRKDGFDSDRSDEAPLRLEALLSRYLQSGEPITFTCVPPGDGLRSALDRDLDGYRDRDEILAGSDPADSNSMPRPKSPTT